MRILSNRLIKASAGTGKTFALTSRMIRLMLLDVEPNHIVALTFSRAAAGEIFNKLAGRLADAATRDDLAQIESGHVYSDLDRTTAELLRSRYGAPIPRKVFSALLRKLIASQHASMIGTIDSFMTRMVQAFPLELGLQGPMTIMDDYRKDRELQASVSDLLNRDSLSPDAGAFFEAFRQATFGRENKAFGEKLASFVATCQRFYLNNTGANAWGNPDVIWPNGFPFGIRDTAEHLAERLAADIRSDWENVGRTAEWDAFCTFVRTFSASIPSSLPAAVKNVLTACRPQTTSIEISYNRKSICFTGAKARLIRETIETLYGLVLQSRCKTTQGFFALMRQFETAYYQNTRRRGLFTFDDIPRLIENLDVSVRQNIEYRFDGRFRHWALDEFQDTSRMQWAAISNLIDEVIQSTEDDRSVLIVGDMKQAIYGWRGGDVSLFQKEADSGHYALSDLSLSFRYCPQIAALVNRVFDGGKIAALLKSSADAAGAKWEKLWLPHISQQGGGFARVERVCEPDTDAGETTADPYIRAACGHLLCVRPWERGLTAAILVRSNEHGKRFADALRHAGIPAVWEGESAICDTPVVTALLHVLHVAEHPGDTLAWQHVCATPLARSVFKKACSLSAAQGPAELSRHVLDDVSRLGLARTLRTYSEAMSGFGTDLFTQARLEELVRAATQFAADADPETMLSDFTAFVEAFVTRDVADTATVKILTIHRSKGLGFDFVLLPVIESNGIDVIRPDEMLSDGNGTWLLSDPGKLVAQSDAVLTAARADKINEGVFEALCVYYVAMTRAKHALVVLLKPPPKKSSQTLYFSNHIEAALGVPLPYSDGDENWFTHADAGGQAADRPSPKSESIPFAREKRHTMRRLTPSAAAYHGQTASTLFSPRDDSAAQRGTQLHEALSHIVWLDESSSQPAEIPTAELDLTVDSEFRNALRKPPHVIDLWRERAFELVDDNQWMSGALDRVVFFDERGQRRAEIFDFKTNRRRENESESAFSRRMEATYAGQMTSYRHALSLLSGLPENAITCTLLLTDTRQAVHV